MKKLFIALLLFPWVAHADQDISVPSIDFSGGLNLYNAPSDISDTESPDMLNMVNGLDGSSFKRNGSRRYIDQAISSWPVTSLYKTYITTGSSYRRLLIATTKNFIVISTNDINPYWLVVASNVQPGQHWKFVTMNNKVIMTSIELGDNVKQFDLNITSFTDLFAVDPATGGITVRGKYPLLSKNYMLLANCQDVPGPSNPVQISTSYNSRVYYSLLVQPSSFTQQRYLEIRTDDGEPITGIGELNGFVHIFEEDNIMELSFNTLNLSNLGGDQTLTQRIFGFGLRAPRTLQNTGDAYIFGAKDGLRWWDGGQKSRLKVEEESRVISLKIKPIIDRCIKAGTWQDAVGYYYPKKQWYILAVEDPIKFPRGRKNTFLAYDLETQSWYPFSNWYAESIVSLDGVGDTGDMIYGDGSDGYVYFADQESAPNDARKELVLDPMDSTGTWKGWFGVNEDKVNVKEGTSAIKLGISNATSISSATLMRIFNIGEWSDKTEITGNDKINFKLYVTSIANISSISVQMQLEDVSSDFNTNYTSVTISTSSLIASNTTWNVINIPLSSFPTRTDWVDLSSETVSTAKNFIVYGIRFVLYGVGITSATIDDLRLIQAKECPLNAYRYTKQYDFGTSNLKRFRQIGLNREISSDSRMTITALADFGTGVNQIPVSGIYSKDLFVAAYNSTNSIQRIDRIDYSVLDSTISMSNNAFDFQYLTRDENNVYAVDKANDRIVKISVSSLPVVISSYGSFGAGTTNFNTIQEISMDDNNLYIADVNNYRIKIHKKLDLSFVGSFGTLGTGATSYHVPTGVDVDDRYIYVGDEGNANLKKVSKSSYTVVTIQTLNINTVADISVRVDDNYVYDCYNTQSEDNFAYQDVILEKRFKDNLKLATRTIIRPKGNSLLQSTYTIQGDISLTDDYIFVSFTDDQNRNGNWYIQQLSKSDLSLVREQKSSTSHSTVIGNGIAYKPKKKMEFKNISLEGVYLQIKYSESDLDNSLKLFNQGFSIIDEGVKER